MKSNLVTRLSRIRDWAWLPESELQKIVDIIDEHNRQRAHCSAWPAAQHEAEAQA